MCGFHIRDEIPLEVIFDHRIIAWGMACISPQIQDLVRGIHQHMLVSGSGSVLLVVRFDTNKIQFSSLFDLLRHVPS